MNINMKSLVLALIVANFVLIVTGHHHCHCHKKKCCKKEVHHHHDHEGKKVYHKHGHGHGHKHSHSHANHHHHHHKHEGGHEHSHGHDAYQQANLATHQVINKGNLQVAQPVRGSLVNNLLTQGQNGAILFRGAQTGGTLYQAVQQGVQNGQQATRAYVLQQPGLAELARTGKLAQVIQGNNRVLLI